MSAPQELRRRLFSGIGTTYLVNEAFRFKLAVFIPVALAWHIFVQQKVSAWGHTSDTPTVGKLSALVEIVLWLCVVTAAVLIPNYRDRVAVVTSAAPPSNVARSCDFDHNEET